MSHHAYTTVRGNAAGTEGRSENRRSTSENKIKVGTRDAANTTGKVATTCQVGTGVARSLLHAAAIVDFALA